MKHPVAGGAGFTGSNYFCGLLSFRWGVNNTSVTLLDALTYAGQRENLAPIEGDPRFKLAAVSHVDRSTSSASEFVNTNVLDTQILLDLVRSHKKIDTLCLGTKIVNCGGDPSRMNDNYCLGSIKSVRLQFTYRTI